MNTVIRVDNLSKKYVIGHQAARGYATFRDAISGTTERYARAVSRLFTGQKAMRADREEFWALQDVSFAVEQGERVGIIGRNGAGKSTLLKILSRITEPTKGRIRLRGRVSSLLEVGTGFHAELSGRENIFLNGAILGMTKAEIKRKFDEIVAFSEIEKFLDTPVKRYSSGMYVRLAFAVAAHLEPEILIVDEVLAVGDAQFQKKCLGKMEEIGKEGRTILFVSHNMNAIKHFCSRAFLIETGSIARQGSDVSEVVEFYTKMKKDNAVTAAWQRPDDSPCDRRFILHSMSVMDSSGIVQHGPASRAGKLWLAIDCEVKNAASGLMVGYDLYAGAGDLLYRSFSTDIEQECWHDLTEGFHRMRTILPLDVLNEGIYRVEFICGIRAQEWIYRPGDNNPSVCFEIKGGLSRSPYWLRKRPGFLAPVIAWEKADKVVDNRQRGQKQCG